MKNFLTLLIGATLTWGIAFSAEQKCIPDNDLYISHTQKGVDMTEDQFNKNIDNIEKIYGPIIKDKYKANLKVFRKWEDGTVNAYARQVGDTWEVHMFGGLARHELVTDDGFMAVVCHEVGHHIGGAPKKVSWWGSAWASNEGQSDYFATTKCLRKFFEKDLKETLDRYNAADKSEQEIIAKNACDEAHLAEAERAICYRGALAGKSLAALLGSLRGNSDVKFDTPDPSVVEKTDDKHPKAQCRMDTYFQGALCDKDQMIFPSKDDAAVGYCMRAESYNKGIRPLCWYKPEE